MTGLLLGAMDQTIVATAGPTIISDLGGLSLYAWVFSGYILAQTVAMPIFGKLSDLYGRKRFFILGLLVFMAGSILSGVAQNIEELIIFRAIQGLGGGAFFPIALGIAGAAFPPAQRGRLTGIFSSVFGIASVVGPAVGSYLTEAINWKWVFYINLPLGVASIVLLSIGLAESRAKGFKPKLDWLGITTLVAWVSLLNLGFLSGGTAYSWYSWEETVFFAGAAIFFAAFIAAEVRAKEPVLPLSFFRNRNISSSTAVSFLRGLMLLAVVSYIPLFIQAGLGMSISDSRNILDAFLLPMIGGSIIGGSLMSRAGYRTPTVAGLCIASAGAYLLTLLGPSAGWIQIMESVAVAGVGIGITFSPTVIVIQNSADKSHIGVASSLAQFMQNLGGTIGLAILGAIQVNTFASKLSSLLQTVPPQLQTQAAAFLGDPNLVGRILSSPSALAQVVSQNPGAAALIPSLRIAFVQSVTPLFTVGLGIGIASVIAALALTGSIKQQVPARAVVEAAKPKEKDGTQPGPL